MTATKTIELEQHLRVFGLAMGCTLEEIKKRKKFLTSITHPDVVAEHLKEQAKEELQKINQAWEEISAWFKDHPGVTATPEPEKPSPEAEEFVDTESESEDDWESWERKKRAQWAAQQGGVDLEALDLKRRRDLAVKNRRDLVIKAKLLAGAVCFVSFLGLSMMSPSKAAREAQLGSLKARAEWQAQTGGGGAYPMSPQDAADQFKRDCETLRGQWEAEDGKQRPSQLLVLAMCGGYLWWLLAPAAKRKTEQWIEVAE